MVIADVFTSRHSPFEVYNYKTTWTGGDMETGFSSCCSSLVDRCCCLLVDRKQQGNEQGRCGAVWFWPERLLNRFDSCSNTEHIARMHVTKNIDRKKQRNEWRVVGNCLILTGIYYLLAETSERFDSMNTELKCEDTLLGCIWRKKLSRHNNR